LVVKPICFMSIRVENRDIRSNYTRLMEHIRHHRWMAFLVTILWKVGFPGKPGNF